jgi:hypothetical protein
MQTNSVQAAAEALCRWLEGHCQLTFYFTMGLSWKAIRTTVIYKRTLYRELSGQLLHYT